MGGKWREGGGIGGVAGARFVLPAAEGAGAGGAGRASEDDGTWNDPGFKVGKGAARSADGAGGSQTKCSSSSSSSSNGEAG